MTTVLVVYASRHGATKGIAERIGEVLRTDGLVAEVAAADQEADIGTPDAVVVGSRIIEEIEKSTAETACANVKALVADIRRGVDEVKK